MKNVYTMMHGQKNIKLNKSVENLLNIFRATE